jgi:ABC-type Na+ efflux pump permease subunit
VGLVSITDPGSTAGEYEVRMGISGEAAAELERVVEAGAAMDSVRFEDRNGAMAAFSDGQVDAVLHADRGERGRIHVAAVAPEGDFRTTLIVTQIKTALAGLERDQRAQLADRLERPPLPVPDPGEANPYLGFTYTVLIPMLVFLPAFISGSITADSLAEELERGTVDLLRVTSLSRPAIVDGKAIAMVTIAPAQAGAWLALLALNGTAIAHPLAILVLVTAITALLVAVGAFLALQIERRRDAQLTYSLLALGLFGVGFLLPESPSNLVAKLAVGNPTGETVVTLVAILSAAVVGYWGLRTAVAGAD